MPMHLMSKNEMKLRLNGLERANACSVFSDERRSNKCALFENMCHEQISHIELTTATTELMLIYNMWYNIYFLQLRNRNAI